MYGLCVSLLLSKNAPHLGHWLLLVQEANPAPLSPALHVHTGVYAMVAELADPCVGVWKAELPEADDSQ